MLYRHTILIKKTTETGGGFGTPPTETVSTKYDGRCDVQDMSAEIKRTVFGDAFQKGGASVFFPRRRFPESVRVDDEVEATYEGITETGRVTDIDRLSDLVTVRWE